MRLAMIVIWWCFFLACFYGVVVRRPRRGGGGARRPCCEFTQKRKNVRMAGHKNSDLRLTVSPER